MRKTRKETRNIDRAADEIVEIIGNAKKLRQVMDELERIKKEQEERLEHMENIVERVERLERNTLTNLKGFKQAASKIEDFMQNCWADLEDQHMKETMRLGGEVQDLRDMIIKLNNKFKELE